jgi:hypothetical protein
MDDHRAVVPPDLCRDPLLEERAEDQLGVRGADPVDDVLRPRGQQHPDVMARLTQRAPGSLAQTVERRHEQQNPHIASPDNSPLRRMGSLNHPFVVMSDMLSDSGPPIRECRPAD